MSTPDISFLRTLPLDTTGTQSAQEDTTVKPEETTVPVGQPDGSAQSKKTTSGKQAASMFQTGQNFDADDLTNNLTSVTVPDEVAGTNSVFGIFGKKTDSQRATQKQVSELNTQVNSGIPLNAKQAAVSSTQLNALLANQSPAAQTVGKAMSYLSSHAGDCLDANGNFKFPDDFKSQPKEVQEYIVKTYGQVTGGQQTQN